VGNPCVGIAARCDGQREEVAAVEVDSAEDRLSVDEEFVQRDVGDPREIDRVQGSASALVGRLEESLYLAVAPGDAAQQQGEEVLDIAQRGGGDQPQGDHDPRDVRIVEGEDHPRRGCGGLGEGVGEGGARLFAEVVDALSMDTVVAGELSDESVVALPGQRRQSKLLLGRGWKRRRHRHRSTCLICL